MPASSKGLNSNQVSSITRKTNDIQESPIIPVMLKLALLTFAFKPSLALWRHIL